ncbi:MAG: class I SAM-dependent methyltransferase [Methylococcales bacterium]
MTTSPVNEPTAFVPETRFGTWFLGTETWCVYVLQHALNDLELLMQPRPASIPAVLEVGFGHGKALLELDRRFRPQRLVGIDADPLSRARAQAELHAHGIHAELVTTNAASIDFPDNSFDVVFCHQTLHHIVAQEAALAEFFRVLKPGGMLLLAESTRRFIHSPPIKILFRHPMHVQKTAEQYIALVRQAGFDVPPEKISCPYLWWSRPDIGVLEWLGFKIPSRREATLVNLVATKPG